MDTKEIRLLMDIQNDQYPCDKKNLELRTVWINNILGGNTTLRPQRLNAIVPLKKIIRKAVVTPNGIKKVIKNRVEPNITHRFTRL